VTRRRLKPDELELWRRVAKTTQRLAPERREEHGLAPKPPVKKAQRPLLQEFEIGQKRTSAKPEHNLSADIAERIARQPVRMDQKTYGKLKRGKVVPEARLDLHGMTMDQAHPALMGFILGAHAQGKRLVLVITGKGKSRDEGGPIPVRHGVLRHNVPQWLSSPPLAQAVLQITEAHVSHGGGGAYYVYLRRQR
jgi:DNA-nicking Smr family endonuclease